MTYLATDTGGTFTDFVFVRDGALTNFKLPSTPDQPDRAIDRGLDRTGRDISDFVHGTTVATNLIVERKGARTALVTTRGFRDVLEIGRQTRPSLYRPDPRPVPLVPRDLRFDVHERVGPDARTVHTLRDEELEDLVRTIRESDVEAVAVCLLFSFLDPSHERRIGEAIGRTGKAVSLSSDVLPLFREYERTSTTVVDAYIKPDMARYMRRLEGILPETRTLIMQSNGGVARPNMIGRRPVNTLYSGPAAGVAAARALGRRTDTGNMITFDMGGTSTDVSTIVDGEVSMTSTARMEGLPVNVPMIDIISVGAGGGSLVWLDRAGALKVGPRSAGAVPGPVCYGRGGRQPTVTDCDLLAGIISPSNFLGGEMDLDPTPASEAMDTLARAADMSLPDLVRGSVLVVNSHMARAVRVVTVERGLEPSDFTLVAFGGAGPVHAAMLARDLGIDRVLVPFAAGVFSAVGLMVADIRMEYSRTLPVHMDVERVQTMVDRAFVEMENEAMDEMRAQDVPVEKVGLVRSLDMRYRGQSFEITVPYEGDLEAAGRELARLHRRSYGYSMDRTIEIVNLNLSAVRKGGALPSPSFEGNGRSGPRERRELLLPGHDGKVHAAVFHWNDLRPGHEGEGPAIIEERGFTALVPPGASWSMDDTGNIDMRLGTVDRTAPGPAGGDRP